MYDKLAEEIISENQCARCDGCGYDNGCMDESCATYKAYELLNSKSMPNYEIIDDMYGNKILKLHIPSNKILNGMRINSPTDGRLESYPWIRDILLSKGEPNTEYVIVTGTIETQVKEGTKLDDGKPKMYDFINEFKDALIYLEKIHRFGTDKYGKANWKDVRDGKNRFLNALVRHLLKLDDEVIDEEVGTYHLANVAYNSLMALHFLLEEEKNK